MKAHQDLTAYLAMTWPDCTCDWYWGRYGTLYGVSMGEGWIRRTTDPACGVHGQRWRKDNATEQP